MNTLKLKSAIAGSGKSNRDIAKMLGLSETGFSYKVHGKNEFKASEIKALAKILRLNKSEIFNIFLSDMRH